MSLGVRLELAALAAVILAGCGGGTEVGIVSSYPSVKLRAINLVPGSPGLTVQDGSATLGTIAVGQATDYSVVNPGLNPLRFVGPSGQVGSFRGQVGYGGYNTVVLCPGLQGDATFALTDVGSATAPGTSQLRIANAYDELPGNVDVYLTVGSHLSPNPTGGTLISGNGIAFGVAMAYRAETPGEYTITVTSALNPQAVLLNQVVTLQPAQATTLYVIATNVSATSIDGP